MENIENTTGCYKPVNVHQPLLYPFSEMVVQKASHPETPTRPEPAPEQSGGYDSIAKEPTPQARHVALPRDAEADGSAVVEVLGAAEPPGGALRGGATQRVPWQE